MGGGYDGYNCSQLVYFRVKDQADTWAKRASPATTVRWSMATTPASWPTWPRHWASRLWSPPDRTVIPMEEQDRIKDMLLRARKAAAVHMDRIKQAQPLTRELLRAELNEYILCKYLLDGADCGTENFNELTERVWPGA